MLEETSWVGSKYLGYGSHAYPLPSRRSPNQHQLRGWEGKPGLQQIIQAPWSREKAEGGKGRRCNQRERGETPHTHRRGTVAGDGEVPAFFPVFFQKPNPSTRGRDSMPLFPRGSERLLQNVDLTASHPFLGWFPLN